jgi:FkbM family methyltransferase
MRRFPDAVQLAGLIRSLAIYYGAPGRVARLRRFYAGFVRRGDLVFDIGAHVGNRTRAFAALGARVVAVEPQGLFHAVLARTLPKRRIHLERAAVGAHVGEVELRVSRAHPTVSSGNADWQEHMAREPAFRRVRWDRVERVPGTTLDELIARHGTPTFCKIDVEGMEAEILRGLSQPLARLSVEVLAEAPDAAAACVDRLAALGDYRFNLAEGEAGHFAWPNWCDGPTALTRLRHLKGHGDLYAFLSSYSPSL